MVRYMVKPQFQLTINSTVVEGPTVGTSIQRIENGFDSGTIILPDQNYWPTTVTKGVDVKLEVKDSGDASYTTLLEGRIRQASPTLDVNGKQLRLKCDGAGYGFGDTVVGDEFGSESKNATIDTITEMVAHASYGIVPTYVNKILGGAASGFSYTYTNVETINDVIKYVYFPYKPCNKAINDLCDIETAIKAGAAGPHWIVTPTADFRLKSIGATQVGWTKYYGDSQANATLEEGVDFESFIFDEIERDANYVIYYGVWRRPGDGDGYTNNSSSLWDHTAADMEITDEAVTYLVGTHSIRFESPTGVGGFAWYPSAYTAGWDIDAGSSPFYVPTVNFHFRRSGAVTDVNIAFCTTNHNNNYNYSFTAELAAADTWYHLKFPIGSYWEQSTEGGSSFAWTKINNPDWSDIDAIDFTWSAAAGVYGYLDGLYIGDVPLCRVARKSLATIATQKLKMKVVTDNIGKDDSLVASDDSGVMARLAYAELLKGQTTPLVGTFTTPMIKDLLPGQYVHIHARETSSGSFDIDKDMRVLRVIQRVVGGKELKLESEITVTDDYYNSQARYAFNDLNTVLSSTRPEFQDRQAASLKAGDIDINVTRLVKEY